jgi:hypothetical protein
MGAICKVCRQDMETAESCTHRTVTLDSGETLERTPYGSDNTDPCGDCGTSPGGVHHRYCDQERCPKCRGQIITCGCVASWLPR